MRSITLSCILALVVIGLTSVQNAAQAPAPSSEPAKPSPATAPPTEPAKTSAAPTPPAEASKTSPPAPAATVNGQVIPELAVQRGLKRVPANRQNEVRAMQLDFLINNTLVDQYLTQLKVAVDAKEVQQRMEQIRGEIKKQGKTLEKVLEELTITEAELQTQVEGDLRWDKFANNQASEAELRKYFEAGREVFDGSQVRARHILLTPASKDGQGEDPAQVQLQVFKKQLEEAGAAAVAKVPAGADPLAKEKARAEALEQGFIALAKEKSACPSKKDGGDTDWFPRTRGMVEPFARAAFGLKPFQLSEVVKTEFGYHLILVTDRRPGKEVKFEDVKNEVKEVYCERLREAIVVYMRPKSKIVISPPPKSGS